MILSDWDIKVYLEKKLLVIKPIFEDTIRENGVDLRFGHSFCRFRDIGQILDSKKVNIHDFMECKDVGEEEGFIIYPREHVLATTLEWIEMPEDLVGLVNLRSTFARLNLMIPPTVIDAGFKGNITIEIIGGNVPVRIYPLQRFLHIVFLRTSSPVYKPYSGKYQGQFNVTPPKPDN
ncbi:MAG: dCTP deaminase [Desulfurococcaceae archaeon]